MNIQHVIKLQNHTYWVYRIACQGDRLVSRDASRGDRDVFGGIVPAINPYPANVENRVSS
jgi:hypothetical protein